MFLQKGTCIMMNDLCCSRLRVKERAIQVLSNLSEIGIRSILIAVLFGIGTLTGKAATPQSTDTIPVYFPVGYSMINRAFLGNNENILSLDKRIADPHAAKIEKIRIVASSSPEGTMESNSAIMERRAQSVRKYLVTKYPHLAPTLTIHIETIDQTLVRFRAAVEEDPLVPSRERVLDILYNNEQSSVMRINAVKQMPAVKTYIERNIYPYMRAASVCIDRELPPPPPPVNDTIRIVERIVTVDTLRIEMPKADTLTVAAEDTTAVADTLATVPTVTAKPLLALKTNLLFDAATVLNMEVEIPIGTRWSVAAEWMFPWWLWEDKQNCFQVMSGNIEGRYWLGNRDIAHNDKPRPLLTGWFAGLYAGGGYYDLERKRTGYQGEFFIAAGISAGYAHTLNKKGNLRMEYALGIGYLKTNYRKYEAKTGNDNEWHLYRRESGKYTWIGPTRAKVSLVWTIDSKKKGGAR